MANEINIILPSSQTGLVMSAVLLQGGNIIGSPIALTESINQDAYYYGDAPTSIANGEYTVLFYSNAGVNKGSGSIYFVNNKEVTGVQLGELNALQGLQPGIPAINTVNSRTAGNVEVAVANYGSDPTTVTRV